MSSIPVIAKKNKEKNSKAKKPTRGKYASGQGSPASETKWIPTPLIKLPEVEALLYNDTVVLSIV